MNRQKVLILTAAYGNGHIQAARALEQAGNLYLSDDVEVQVVDFMQLVHPHINPFSHYVFINGIQKFPYIYGYLYQKTRISNSSLMLRTLNLLSIKGMRKLLSEIQPSVIVSTFPLAAAAVSLLKSKGLTDVPTVTVITDYSNHSFWVYPFTDHYIVGSDRVKYTLSNLYNVHVDKITVTGIPIKAEFILPYSKSSIYKKHGLDPSLQTVLLMGGGDGIFTNLAYSLKSLEKLPQRIQLIVVCGNNERLKQTLSEELRYSKHNIVLTGYIDYVYELMAISDLLVTKAGGLTTTEALALELPMLLYKPIPGQEEDNASYLIDEQAAMLVQNADDLANALIHMLSNPTILDMMKKNTKRLQMKWAAIDALKVITHARNKLNKEVKQFMYN